jgi:cytochrome c556
MERHGMGTIPCDVIAAPRCRKGPYVLRMARNRGQLLLALLTGICLMRLVIGASADSDVAHIKYRQHLMQGIGGNMGAIAVIVRAKLPHQRNIVAHAQQLRIASLLVESAFKTRTPDEQSDAKPGIWNEWSAFVAAAQRTVDESSKLAQVAETGDLAAIDAQVKVVVKTCGECHRQFRKAKAERTARPRALADD